MSKHNLFTLVEIAEICGIDIDLLKNLDRFGIIEIHLQNNEEFISCDAIDVLMIAERLHVDLGINMEGIDAILSMRKRILNLQDRVAELENKVKHLVNEQKYRNLEIIIEKGLLRDL